MSKHLVLIGWLLIWLAVNAADADKKPFYLPNNPRAAAYILGRLSNQELIAAPRSEYVYVALLERAGLERKYRTEALQGLAALRKTEPLVELVKALQELDQKGEKSLVVLRELVPILLSAPRKDLDAQREALSALAKQGQLPFTHQFAGAALIRATDDFNTLWGPADDKQKVDLLLGIPLLREGREKCYAIVEPLVALQKPIALRHAAMQALAAIPGHDATTFSKLADFVSIQEDWLAAVNALQQLPKSTWPKAQAEPLLRRLLQRLEAVPTTERSEDAVVGAVTFGHDLASLLPPESARAASKSLRALGVQVIMLRTVYEQMLYDKNLLVAEAGKPLQLTLQNDDAMPHNLVIVLPEAVEEIGHAAEKLTPEPDASGRVYVPDSPKVLHATKMLNSGERAKLVFDAPTEPGDYGYVCTFPGHWLRMRGTLRVVPDLDTYLATHAEPQAPVFTEWTLEQLEPDLAKVGPQRDLNRGRELFNTLACAQCHKLGPIGYAYGPNLDDVLVRWKGDLKGVLVELLQPSKVIADRYRNFEFVLKDGESATGMILEETAAVVKVQSGPSDALIQSLLKVTIAERKPQQLSVMPAGLLSTLNREQIVDLLSFVQSGAHRH